MVAQLDRENLSFLALANIDQARGDSLGALISKNSEPCRIGAETVLAVLLKADGTEEILFQRNIAERRPIASITKLMAAVVANDFFQPDSAVIISDRALGQADATGLLSVGEKVKAKDLEKMMLIESSNDAAYALSELMNAKEFLFAMNAKAKDLSMNDTYYFNVTGLDADVGLDDTNYSTAQDLVKLARYVLQQPEIMSVIAQKDYELYIDGVYHHRLVGTNELLGEASEVIGGKTGTTDLAGQCLLEILTTPNLNEYIVMIVLNSPNRFEDMRNLIKCSR